MKETQALNHSIKYQLYNILLKTSNIKIPKREEKTQHLF